MPLTTALFIDVTCGEHYDGDEKVNSYYSIISSTISTHMSRAFNYLNLFHRQRLYFYVLDAGVLL